MNSPIELIESFLVHQNIVMQCEPVLEWARLTGQLAQQKDLPLMALSISSSYSEDCEFGNCRESSLTMRFKISESLIREFDLRWTSSNDGTEVSIWCGPSHLPASSEAIQGFLEWIRLDSVQSKRQELSTLQYGAVTFDI